MEKKTLNNSENGYYAVIITAVYYGGLYSDDKAPSYKEFTPRQFKKVLPMLKVLLKNAIGKHKLEKYLENMDDNAISGKKTLPSDYFCKTLGITDLSFVSCEAYPHTIESADDVKILYFDPDGKSYRINLM